MTSLEQVDYVELEQEFPYLDPGTIDQHFPKEHYREGQKEAIEYAVDAFNQGKKIVIIEAPTGSGKSAIGMTVADMVDRSYYLTVTKILQDQLTADFGDKIVELKGRNAYPCTFYDRYGDQYVKNKIWSDFELSEAKKKSPDFGNGICRSKLNQSTAKGKKFKCEQCFLKTGVKNTGKPKGQARTLPFGMEYSACPYYNQVYKAIDSRKVVMNFSSFLFQTQMTNRFDEQRDLLTIDECHNVEPQLLDFVSFTITDQHLNDQGIFIPELDHAHEYKVWMEEAKVFEALFNRIRVAREQEDSKLEDELSRVLHKFKMFLDNMKEEQAEWVCEYESKETYNKLTLKPVFAHKFVHKLLFKYSKRVLMLSATVLDVNVMCRSLGIDRSEVAAYRVKNRFPKENRPIKIRAVGKLTGGKARMNEWGPLLVSAVDNIVCNHAGEKGIIHTHNFAIMDLLLRRCSGSVKKRLLNQRSFKDKRDMLADHAAGSSDSVLIAPAMHEGIDLKGDLSRFQIICKVPYANCFDDQQLARRVEVDRKYYIWLTALKLIQSYGRSVRSETDYAVTYILDESIFQFMKDADKMLPDWFKEAIIEE
jgi:Rad3-related DNA helicase